MLKALFVLKIFTFLSRSFSEVRKRLDKIAKFNFKIYELKGWEANSYNTHIAQYLRK